MDSYWIKDHDEVKETDLERKGTHGGVRGPCSSCSSGQRNNQFDFKRMSKTKYSGECLRGT